MIHPFVNGKEIDHPCISRMQNISMHLQKLGCTVCAVVHLQQAAQDPNHIPLNSMLNGLRGLTENSTKHTCGSLEGNKNAIIQKEMKADKEERNKKGDGGKL